MYFKDLGLIPEILKAAEEAGYETPSPIQEKAIPPVLKGQDLLGCAQTGTGKTAAFAMPILQRLNSTPQTKPKPIRALILTPTRELALQISESFASYGKHLKLHTCVIFGGVGQNPQVAELKRGVDILVATPGRLNDLINQGFIKLDKVEIFVLDEADRMLDMGFVHDVKRVLTYLPPKKQTLLFSATMPKEIEDLVNTLLHSPAKVYVTPPSSTVDAIEQSIYFVDKGNKRFLLASLLKGDAVGSALVFTRTKHGADRVVRELEKDGVAAMAIHGNKSQNARQAALGKFKNGEIRVLVATDIAARGIDINELTHVVNYDLPNIPETYVHRIGRTGRAGQTGIAISFCNFDELEYLADIEKLAGKKIPVVNDHKWPMVIMQKSEKTTQQRPPRADRQQGGAKSPRGSQHAEHSAKNDKKHTPREEKRPQPQPKEGKPQLSKQNSKFAKEMAQGQNKARKQSIQPNRKSEGNIMENRHASKPYADKKDVGHSAPRPVQQESAPQSDDSLRVITRKAPAQKFASFEDFMKSQK
ncbi:MAG: DEAD/DEAH box helicase [Oscillospiraceae bacterium]